MLSAEHVRFRDVAPFPVKKDIIPPDRLAEREGVKKLYKNSIYMRREVTSMGGGKTWVDGDQSPGLVGEEQATS